MPSAESFNEDYYERGVQARVSGYQQYRWMPERVLPLANFLKPYCGVDACGALDYGCAKGFLVKALRLLEVQAYGYDVSEYAIKNCEPEVKNFVSATLPVDAQFQLVFSKDTLEHVEYSEILDVLKSMHGLTKSLCVIVVPLADNYTYRIREYELDVTHRIREDEVWWINLVKRAGFKVQNFSYSLPGAKDRWLDVHPYGNACLILKP